MKIGDTFKVGKAECVWQGDIVDPKPGNYYVSCVDGGRMLLLLGPFVQHADALAQVEAVRKLAGQLDPWSHFYSFGTVGLADVDVRPGKLNAQMGYCAGVLRRASDAEEAADEVTA